VHHTAQLPQAIMQDEKARETPSKITVLYREVPDYSFDTLIKVSDAMAQGLLEHFE